MRDGSGGMFMTCGIIHHSLEIDDDNRLVADYPGIVAAWQQRHVAGTAVEFRSVIHTNPKHARDMILKMRCFAARRLGDGLYGRGPPPSRFKYGAADGSASDIRQFQAALREFTYLVRGPETLEFSFFRHWVCWLGHGLLLHESF